MNLAKNNPNQILFVIHSVEKYMGSCSSNEGHSLQKIRVSVRRGFTLMEVMIVTALLTLVIAGATGAICSGRLISRRLSDYSAAMAVVEAKMADIRNATYNPPNSPFGSTTVVLTSASSNDLDQAGVSFVVSGTVTSKIEPTASGHLVTVTGTFNTRRTPITVSLQSVVNKFSAGQQ